MNAHELLRLGRRLARFGMPLFAALLFVGCETAHEHSLTYKLWDKSRRDACKPASDPHFAAFASEKESDVLVIYDALSERKDKIERRAYFVYANESRIVENRTPRYVDPALATNMNTVPVVRNTNAVAMTGLTARYPVNIDGVAGFELYLNGQSEGTHNLPRYDEGMHPATQIALTPLAAAGDTIMVSAVVGAVAAMAWVSVGCPPFSQSH